MNTITHTTELNLYDCTQCGALIALSKNLERVMRTDHRTFYCPNGHHQYFPQESAEEKLRKSLHDAEMDKTRLSHQAAAARAETTKKEAELAAAKREAARLKKRAAAGVCPCCTRTVGQLARHMKTKHPDYTA